MQLYADADGDVFTENAVGAQLETGAWEARAWDTAAGVLVVDTGGTTLWLVTVEEADLPAGADPSAGDPAIEDPNDS